MAIIVIRIIKNKKYRELENAVLAKLEFPNWNLISYYDAYVTVKSRATLEKYDDVKFFKENKEKFAAAENIIKRKDKVYEKLTCFLKIMIISLIYNIEN